MEPSRLNTPSRSVVAQCLSSPIPQISAARRRLSFSRTAPSAGVLTLILLLSGCGSSSPRSLPITTLPTTSTTAAAAAASTTPVLASADCKAAFKQGHDNEAAGIETFAAFQASVQKCSSAAEWTAAAKAIGVDLDGQEPVFLDRTCNAGDAKTKALQICQEVKGKDK